MLILLALFGIASKSEAQRTGRKINLPFYDERKLHYGFQIGLFNSTLNVRHSEAFANSSDSTRYLSGQSSFGFSLGFILNISLKDELWSLRILPNVAFYERNVKLRCLQCKEETEPLQDTYIELPVLFKYRSLRRWNHRMYMIGGLQAGLKVGGKKASDQIDQLILNSNTLEVTYGFGFDLYFEMFKFAPEIRISHGLTNILAPGNTVYNQNISDIYSHKVTLFLNFE